MIEAGKPPGNAEPELQGRRLARCGSGAAGERRPRGVPPVPAAQAQGRDRRLAVPATNEPADRSRRPQRRIASLLLPPASAMRSTLREPSQLHRSTALLLPPWALAAASRDRRGQGRDRIAWWRTCEEPAAELLAGPTVNSITPCSAGGQPGLPSHLRANGGRRGSREALHHQRLPFEVALRELPDGAGERLHAVNLVVHRSYSGTRESEREQGSFSLAVAAVLLLGTPWDLNFFLIWRDEGWRMSREADASLYDPRRRRNCRKAGAPGWKRWWPHPTFAWPTVRRCAALPREPQPRPWTRLALQTDGHREPIPVHDPARQIVRFNEDGNRTPMIAINNRSVYYQLARAGRRPTVNRHPDLSSGRPAGPLGIQLRRFRHLYACGSSARHSPAAPISSAAIAPTAPSPSRPRDSCSAWARRSSWSACSTHRAPGYRESMSREEPGATPAAPWIRGRLNRIEQYRRGEIGMKDLRLGADPAPSWPPDTARRADGGRPVHRPLVRRPHPRRSAQASAKHPPPSTLSSSAATNAARPAVRRAHGLGTDRGRQALPKPT